MSQNLNSAAALVPAAAPAAVLVTKLAALAAAEAELRRLEA